MPFRLAPQALQSALHQPDTPEVLASGFRQLVLGRRRQVTERQPLAALVHLRAPEDQGVSLVGLRAERLPLAPGTCWAPTEQRLALVVRGRLELKVRGAGEPVDVHVRPWSHGAQVATWIT